MPTPLRTFAVLLLLPLLAAFQPIDPNAIDLSLLRSHAAAQPDDFAVACMPLNNRAGSVLINPAERFPLASVSKLMIFVEYARRLDAGEIGMGEAVLIETLNRYDLNRTDRGAHDDWIETYPAGTTSISLYDVAARGMLQYSSNAASDFMLTRLAPTDWDALYGMLFMNNTDAPHPLSAIPLMMNNHDDGQASFADLGERTLADGVAAYERYVADEDWRNEEIRYRSSFRRTFPAWDVQATLLQNQTATGTVYDFVNLMSIIYGDSNALTPGTKQLVRGALRWYGNERIDATYTEYGSKLGFYSGGVLTLVAYGQSVGGQPVIAVIFLRNVPRDIHRSMLWEDTLGDFAHYVHLNGCGAVNGLLAA